MNEDLIDQIDKATAAHAMWKAKLILEMEGRSVKIDRQTAKDCHACAFGMWLDGNKSQLSGNPEFEPIYTRHEAFHQEVGAILEKIVGGRLAEAKESFQAGTFRQVSSRLVLDLLRWRDRLEGL